MKSHTNNACKLYKDFVIVDVHDFDGKQPAIERRIRDHHSTRTIIFMGIYRLKVT